MNRIALALTLLLSANALAVVTPSPSSQNRSAVHADSIRLRWKARGLQRTIAKTERHIDANLADARVAETAVVQREQQVEQNRRSKRGIMILGALMGAPLVMAAGAIGSKNDDQRLTELRADLFELQRQRRRLDAKIAAHRIDYKTAMGEFASLAARARTVDTNLRALELAPKSTSARDAGRKIALADSLVAIAREEYGIVSKLDLAADRLDSATFKHFDAAEASLQKAETIAKASRDELIELIKVAIAPNPNMAAGKWITKQVTKMVTDRLVEAGLKGPVGKELAKQLAKKIVGPNGNQQEVDDFADDVGTQLDAA